MPQPTDTRAFGLSTGRLEALSDGVLAIVITLLVLNFAEIDQGISENTEVSSSVLTAHLLGLWPHLLGYVLSFVLIAIYWIVHHFMFHHIRHANRGLLWLNLLFLMAVAFLPFPTDLLAKFIYHESNVITALYGVSHAVAGLALAGMWRYATANRRLVAEDLPLEFIRATLRMALLGPAVYALGVAVSFWSIPLGISIYALAPLLYIVPGHVDRLWTSLSPGGPAPFQVP